jgi:UDP-3-O-acyl N-acetylglucosamine deacetylase
MAENQKTSAKDVSFSGRALQTGHKVEMVCRPAGPGTGIIFRRTDIPERPAIRLRDVVLSDAHDRRSTIGRGSVEVQTVEHFLAALWGLGIDNLEVEIDGKELPAMDGSAAGFLAPLQEAGLVEQPSQRRVIRIEEPIKVGDGGRSLSILPGEGFSVLYEIDYNVACIGRERFEIELDGESFEREIAPARTFCTGKEALMLLISGLGRGANLKNTLVLGNSGPLGTDFRFPNEPVRHKILDLVGDLYMLGMPLVGTVVAVKSGHKLNSAMVKRLHEKYIKHA